MSEKNPTVKSGPHHDDTVFEAARNLTNPVRRKAYLDRVCAGDAALRARVEELLALEAEADRFFADNLQASRALRSGLTPSAMERRSTEALATSFVDDEKLGSRIGRYKLLEKIGEGGCGAVYMAEQQEPVRRKVALKIIKLGMDTKSVIARFEAERQALAMMDHPNIARVLDAGATEVGRPYFVMELVRGFKITEYCDQNKLDTAQRLALFVQVCQAIQHAHQKGIIHRDIKPSNILVTLHDGVPVPKVIDFGIAKATEAPLTDKTLFTSYAQIIGTPAYMSPEQAEMSGLDVDTRSDIYSLGVLLYELLTGKTPFDTKELLESGLDEMRRTLREKEPHRPSTKLGTLHGTELTKTALHRQAEPLKLRSQLSGDLDWIVMKALEKDRRRRYETANGLALDILRHLNNEPVVARPYSRMYRFQKLVRRNQLPCVAAAAVAAALLMGLGTSTWLFFQERKARKRAVAAELQQAHLRERAEMGRANEAVLRRQAEARETMARAAVLVSRNRHEDADQLIAQLPQAEPILEGASMYRTLGEWNALQGRWKPAADRLSSLLQVDQLEKWDISSLDVLACGSVLLELGDTNAYEQFRTTAIARFEGVSDPVVAERTVKISLLLPPRGEHLVHSLGQLAGVAAGSFTNVAANAAEDVTMMAWRSVSLALLEYRRGDWRAAEAWCRKCLEYTKPNAPRAATARVILAMVCQRLGLTGEAQSELAQGREVIETKFTMGLDVGDGNQGFWFDWLFARILLREATTQINSYETHSPEASVR